MPIVVQAVDEVSFFKWFLLDSSEFDKLFIGSIG